MNQPGYHKVDPGQKCRILTIQVAVPVAHPSDIADEMTSLLTAAIADEQSNVLDWQYVPGCGPEDANFAMASDEPVEGEIFTKTVAVLREQMLEKILLDCLNALKDAATVVDAGYDEGYAYQHEIEAAEAVLTADPLTQRAQEDIPALKNAPPPDPKCAQVRNGLPAVESQLMQDAKEIRRLASLLPEEEITRKVILAAHAFDIERAAEGLRQNRLDMKDWVY